VEVQFVKSSDLMLIGVFWEISEPGHYLAAPRLLAVGELLHRWKASVDGGFR
jgi:hypothetical protein